MAINPNMNTNSDSMSSARRGQPAYRAAVPGDGELHAAEDNYGNDATFENFEPTTSFDNLARDPRARVATAYCSNCGAANRHTARFCRSCGESLDDQIPANDGTHTYGRVGQKSKYTMAEAPAPMYSPATVPVFSPRIQIIAQAITSVIIECFTAAMVIGGITVTIRYGTFLPLALLFTWMAVVALRNGLLGRRH